MTNAGPGSPKDGVPDYRERIARIRDGAERILGVAATASLKTLAEALSDPAVSDEEVQALAGQSREVLIPYRAMGGNPGDAIDMKGPADRMKSALEDAGFSDGTGAPKSRRLLTSGTRSSLRDGVVSRREPEPEGSDDRTYMNAILQRLGYRGKLRAALVGVYETDPVLMKCVHAHPTRKNSYYCFNNHVDAVTERLRKLRADGQPGGRPARPGGGVNPKGGHGRDELVSVARTIRDHGSVNRLRQSKYKDAHLPKRICDALLSKVVTAEYFVRRGPGYCFRRKDIPQIGVHIDGILTGILKAIDAEMAGGGVGPRRGGGRKPDGGDPDAGLVGDDLVSASGTIGRYKPVKNLGQTKYKGADLAKRVYDALRMDADAVGYFVVRGRGFCFHSKDVPAIGGHIERLLPGILQDIDAERTGGDGRKPDGGDGHQGRTRPYGGSGPRGAPSGDPADPKEVLTLARIETEYGIHVGDMQNYAVVYSGVLGTKVQTADELDKGYTRERIEALQKVLKR